MNEIMKKLDNKTVKGANGWIVRIPNIHRVEYSEKNKSTVLEIEGGSSQDGTITWYVYIPNPWLWQDKNNRALTGKEREVIISRIQASFGLLEMKIEKINI
jgi:hypothetical protein